jgi:hypothetical protein
LTVPADWEHSFAIVIDTLHFWEDESPDLRGTRNVVEGLLEDCRKFMGIA